MRVLFLSLAAILVASSTVYSQVVEGPVTLEVVVTEALNEIVSATDIAIADVANQQDLSISAVRNLAIRVGVTGPIPAVTVIVSYWQAQFLRYAQTIVDQLKSIYAQILESIRYQVVQLTQCSNQDINALIAEFIQIIEGQCDNIRLESNQRLIQILSTSNAIAIRLHELALQDCGRNLVILNNKLIEVLDETINALLSEWAQRTANLRRVTLTLLNELLVRIQQLASRTIELPAIDPPSC